MNTDIILAHPELLAKGEITVFCLIMDRSGSMRQHGDAPRKAINEHIKSLQTHPNASSAFGFVVTFADNSRYDIEPQPLVGMPELEAYDADGGTMLFSTVIKALDELLKLKAKGESLGLKVNLDLTVFTDGEDTERPSRSEELIRLAASALEAHAHLMLCAIGRDKESMARKMGFPPQDAVQIAGTAQAIRQTMMGVTRRTHVTMMGCTPVPSSTPDPSSLN